MNSNELIEELSGEKQDPFILLLESQLSAQSLEVWIVAKSPSEVEIRRDWCQMTGFLDRLFKSSSILNLSEFAYLRILQELKKISGITQSPEGLISCPQPRSLEVSSPDPLSSTSLPSRSTFSNLLSSYNVDDFASLNKLYFSPPQSPAPPPPRSLASSLPQSETLRDIQSPIKTTDISGTDLFSSNDPASTTSLQSPSDPTSTHLPLSHVEDPVIALSSSLPLPFSSDTLSSPHLDDQESIDRAQTLPALMGSGSSSNLPLNDQKSASETSVFSAILNEKVTQDILEISRSNEFSIYQEASVPLKPLFNEFGQTILHVSAEKGRIDLLELMLPIQSTQSSWITATLSSISSHIKFSSSDLRLFRKIDWSLFLNFKDRNGWTPLHSACYCGKFQVVVALISGQRGTISLMATSADGSTPLHYIVRHPFSHEDESSGLMSSCFTPFFLHGASVNSANSVGDTPLHIAVKYSSANVIRLLLENNGDPNLQNKYLRPHPISSLFSLSPHSEIPCPK